ncbi:succinate dehydrogenase [Halomonas heilongjiangensis]|uniref:Succinate dehydrogenase n=1 Tax=Halomonas heilongjiangensis TaxID=1387883 RepID=A0A2N7TJ81_9GAMM|nr:succinate dehydrogenase [Halomonas heilongjiangensis]PMR68247.1 succinate dehydrogenase [Halomonas heilongjiangensis]PXX87490.1 succinate dehydrogenase [Halomonas heilongjiangensis]PXX89483.1 succinate dehydrogenase [Halomonas heilongjiangensis]PXX93214.1 succinate dehydrogenase [Halomonas heilongjiangensis]
MSPRHSAFLWLAQRVSALVLAFCVLVHLITMIIVVQGGLTAAEILARTQGSIPWLLFYSLFVIAVAIHAPIGLRHIAREHLKLGSGVEVIVSLFGLLLLILGSRAIWGVFS